MPAHTFVLIPGAGGVAAYWHLVAAELERHGHEAIAVDLPADNDTAALPEYADVVVDAIGDRRGIVLVAQSMAGFTAPLVCQRVPVVLLVLLNAMIPAPGETVGEWWGNTGSTEARRQNDLRDGRDPDAPFDMRVAFFHDVPQAEVDAVFRTLRAQSDTAYGSPLAITAWPDVPTRVLVGRDDRFFPAEFQRRVARKRLGIDADEIPGGHLVALSYPVGVAARLVAYAAQVPQPAP